MSSKSANIFNCDVCAGKDFQDVKNSFLIQHYSFIKEKNLINCRLCGAKYLICQNCTYPLARVHLSLDKFSIKVKCSKCGQINKELLNRIRK